VSRFLQDLKDRYGGVDAVLLWPGYPNIGIDARNQHELLADLPGGLDGVRQAVRDFHKLGVKVLIPALPWDTGTHENKKPLPEQLASVLKYIEADGINGDTMLGVPEAYMLAADKEKHPLALEPERALSNINQVKWNTMTWGYWPEAPLVPPVSLYRWVEQKHMVNLCERWAKKRRKSMQDA